MTNQSNHETQIRELHRQLLDAWNKRNAQDFAALYEADGNQIGFDGSQMNGQVEIQEHLSQIFADHMTAAYVSKVREVRFLNDETAILRAVVSMIPHGQTDINPALNAVQSLVAVRRGNQWKVALFHNTPAAFHGRPEAVAQLTEELRQWREKGV
jgi:uncharacterized protein (TIGR02246 family)